MQGLTDDDGSRNADSPPELSAGMGKLVDQLLK